MSSNRDEDAHFDSVILYDPDSSDEEKENCYKNNSEMKSQINKSSQKRTTETQFEMIIKFMHGTGEKLEFSEDWNKLVDELNAVGPPSRDCTGWRKVWNNYKRKLKRKWSTSDVSSSISKTGVVDATTTAVKPAKASTSSNGDSDKREFDMVMLQKMDKVLENHRETNSHLVTLIECMKQVLDILNQSK